MYNKYWGPATWTLFHILAEKLNNDILVKPIIQLIKQICRCLPCPVCREHSTRILQHYKLYHKINTKEDLKRFIWEFHNQVNIKLHYPIYNFKDLNKYSNYSLEYILKTWLKYFNIFVTDVKLYTIKNQIHSIKLNTQSFIKNNIDKFIIT